ncbi:hypothetical protein RI367_003730 [Sorochytrium milnesiophthora]
MASLRLRFHAADFCPASLRLLRPGDEIGDKNSSGHISASLPSRLPMSGWSFPDANFDTLLHRACFNERWFRSELKLQPGTSSGSGSAGTQCSTTSLVSCSSGASGSASSSSLSSKRPANQRKDSVYGSRTINGAQGDRASSTSSTSTSSGNAEHDRSVQSIFRGHEAAIAAAASATAHVVNNHLGAGESQDDDDDSFAAKQEHMYSSADSSDGGGNTSRADSSRNLPRRHRPATYRSQSDSLVSRFASPETQPILRKVSAMFPPVPNAAARPSKGRDKSKHHGMSISRLVLDAKPPKLAASLSSATLAAAASKRQAMHCQSTSSLPTNSLGDSTFGLSTSRYCTRVSEKYDRHSSLPSLIRR